MCLAPFESLGIRERKLLVSMPPYGSEILDPAVDLRATNIARLGLSFTMASALIDALTKLYGGSHG